VATYRTLLMAIVLGTAVPAAAFQADPLTRAREAYNLQQFDRALQLAGEAGRTPALAHSASLVAARALLERYRRTHDVVDIASARQALLSVDPMRLLPAEGPELHLAMAELLYVDDEFGAAAEMFEAALDRPGLVPAAQRSRVLEWWAASLDRDAQLAPDGERQARYRRILARLERESARGPASPVVAYWLAAATRGVDDPERAWALAIAGWIQAPAIAGADGPNLRADLDELMTEAIIPERARRAAPHADPEAYRVALLAEWTSIKDRWSRSGIETP
jgi:hypothetical protein